MSFPLLKRGKEKKRGFASSCYCSCNKDFWWVELAIWWVELAIWWVELAIWWVELAIWWVELAILSRYTANRNCL